MSGRKHRAWLVNKTGKRPGRKGFYVGWHEWDNKGERHDRRRQFDSFKLASLYVERYNAARDLQLAGEVVRISVEDAGAEFISGCSALAEATQDLYESAIGLLELHGATFLGDVDAVMIDRIIASRTAEVKRATVARDLKSLTRFFNWAMKRNYLADNPIKLATSKPKSRHARIRPHVSDEQLATLIGCLDTDDRRLAVWLGMTTALDRGVIEALTADQIDLDTWVIRSRRTKTGNPGVAPLHPMLAHDLARRVRGAVPGTPLLHGLSRQKKKRDWWHLATKAAGVPSLLFRDLRAVASSRLLRAGVALPDVQRLLGHASPETTATHYLTPADAAVSVLGSLPLPGHPKSGGSKTG